MEKNKLPPARKGEKGSKLKKIITFFTCVVLVLSSIFIYNCAIYTNGYQYYQTFEANSILIGQTVQENFLDKTIKSVEEELTDNGYYIVGEYLEPDILVEEQIVKKSQTNDQTIEDGIKKSLQVDVLLTKLTITGEDNTYYFKTEKECQTFVNELNEISKVETHMEGVADSYKLVSSQDSLQQLKDKYQQIENEKKAAAAKRNQVQVTSRGGVHRTNKTYHPPMASYVYISSEYGPRWGKTHTGVDFAANAGTEVYSWKNGTVTYAGWNGSYGNFIEVTHNDGTISRYAHLSKILVSKGQIVTENQHIGNVGSTGNSTGPHLHFEIKVNGSFVNPLNYL